MGSTFGGPAFEVAGAQGIDKATTSCSIDRILWVSVWDCDVGRTETQFEMSKQRAKASTMTTLMRIMMTPMRMMTKSMTMIKLYRFI